MKTLLYNILIILGSTFFFSIGVGFAQSENDQYTLQSRMEKLEKENEEKTTKIKSLEDQLTLQKYAIDHFDMILTQETLFFGGIISVGLLIAGLITFGGFIYQVGIIKREMKSEIVRLNTLIETQITKSNDSLIETELYTQSQWGDLTIALARTYEPHSVGVIYYTLKACYHYCKVDDVRKIMGNEKLEADTILYNLDVAIENIEGRRDSELNQESLFEDWAEVNWEDCITTINLYDNIEVKNKISNIRLSIFT